MLRATAEMFSSVSFDPAALASEFAETTARSDRERFLPVLELSEQFLIKKQCIAFGETALLMVSRPAKLPLAAYTSSAYTLTVYSKKPMAHARELCDEIIARSSSAPDCEAALGGVDLTSLVAAASPNGARVKAEQRAVVDFVELKSHKGADLFDAIVPSTRGGLFSGSPMLCVGVEMQLIETYTQLSNPSLAGDWGKLLKKEHMLRTAFLSERSIEVGKSYEGGKTRGHHDRERSKALAALEDRFASLEGRVIVSDSIFNGRSSKVLVCVSALGAEYDSKEISQISVSVGVTLQTLHNYPKLPTDPRLQKLSVYVKRPDGSRELIMNVYNLAEYEAVPFLRGSSSKIKGKTSKRAKYGTAVVAARFLLLEMWTIRLLWKLNSISSDFAKNRTEEIFGRYAALSKAMENSSVVFPEQEINFVGMIEDKMIASKREGRDGKRKKFTPPYYPYKHANKTAEGGANTKDTETETTLCEDYHYGFY